MKDCSTCTSGRNALLCHKRQKEEGRRATGIRELDNDAAMLPLPTARLNRPRNAIFEDLDVASLSCEESREWGGGELWHGHGRVGVGGVHQSNHSCNCERGGIGC